MGERQCRQFFFHPDLRNRKFLLLSVPELHRFSVVRSRTVTAGGELHPALKNPYELIYKIPWWQNVVKFYFLW